MDKGNLNWILEAHHPPPKKNKKGTKTDETRVIR